MNERVPALLVHVLLVEDHVQLRRILQHTLTQDGFRVTAAENADKARSILADGFAADILLTDIRMPGALNGLELARWARAHRPDVAVLLQTGFVEVDTEDFRVLRKPFSPDELSAQLRAAASDRGTAT